ncbi:MAG: acetyl-CoA decarbonylase/synthase complex subunit delta [Proteobacteria bacterium]|nr:acetyl-CoA decarbonylase/synthase complex subunit delta [Pseudomonadota bacterium]MBU1056885.1 acetyl-CoA decarbonylase/synthase complex subunit delta [Pseudomonadota bacterium]
MKSGSNLETLLKQGTFAVTGELGPPKNGNPEIVREKARLLKGNVDAVNITDCQTAIVRMSSIAAGLIAKEEGVEPVIQMTCRDRNRIGMQSDILGASALGLKNLLCLTGDHQKFGNHPGSKGVFDMDSIQLLGMMKGMRDDKRFQCGEEIKSNEPRLFLGAAANPFAHPFEYRAVRLGKKVTAGADFVQTQIIYNVEKFAKFMEMVRDLGIDKKCYILAGVTPPKSLGMARYMKNFVPGMEVPDDIIRRMKDAKDKQKEGIQICVDIIKQVKEIKGVSGIHCMAIEWESAVPEILKRAGLLPRPGITEADEPAVAEESRQAIIVQARVTDELLEKAKSEAEQIIAVARAEAERLMEMAKSDAPQASTPSAIDTTTSRTTDVPQGADDSGEHEMNEKERIMALEAVQQGLAALKKAYGLSDDQFEALSSFAGAQVILKREAEMTAPAPPTPAAAAVTPAAPLAPAPVVDDSAEKAAAAAKVKAEAEAKAAAEAKAKADADAAAAKAKSDAEAKAAAEAKAKTEEEARVKADAAAKAAEEAKVKAEAEAKTATAAQTVAPAPGFAAVELAKESTTLAERSSKVDPKNYQGRYTGKIRAVTLGNGDTVRTVGGSSSMPFQLFEGEHPHKPLIAMEVTDVKPDEWPQTLTQHFSDVLDNPVAWAQKCVKIYGAEAVAISLGSTDPNGMNRPAAMAAKVAAEVIAAVDVPIIIWGCGNSEKDTETLREITSMIGDKKICLAPLEDSNYRTIGATAMAFQHPIVAASPIDVNLAKQLNILLENLGVPLDSVLMDPSIGALGYGIEYTYSVMERIRIAALTQQDDKLQVPIICNLGCEVWKAKETKLPSDDMIGDQEIRGIMMEALTASCMLMAGGEIMIMRHPKAIAMTKSLISGLMD